MQVRYILLLSVFCVAAAVFACVAAATGSARPPASFDGFARTSLYVPSADGTRIAVDVYLPTRAGVPAAGRLPVIFTQSRAEARRSQAGIQPFIDRGYAVVAQERRGTGASFGVQKGFVNLDDARDAKAAVEWAGAQPWSNGKVGGIGCSNQGAHQYLLATLRPKYLVALAPDCATPDFFGTMISQNGVSSFVQGSQPPYAGECTQPTPLGIPVDADPAPDFPLAHAAALEHRCNAKFLGQYFANMHRDSISPYLGYAPGLTDSAVEQADAVRRSGIHFLNIGGWFDASPAGVFLAWQLWGGRAVVGPWVHGQAMFAALNAETSRAAPAAAPARALPYSAPELPAGKLDIVALQLRWFDALLKGEPNGALRDPAIWYYTINAPPGREWRGALRWPLPKQRLTTWYLSPDKAQSIDSLNDGTLTPSSGAARTVSYTADYGVKLFDGRYQLLQRHSTLDQRASDRRGLTYTLPALAADLEVTGHPLAHLWVTSTSADEDFYAVLEDVAPDGASTYVADGKLRASQRVLARGPVRDLPWHPQLQKLDRPLSASKPAELVFAFYPISYVFRAGHRVRVTILNSISDAYQAPPGRDAAHPPSITLHQGGRMASSITLPVIAGD
jgi:uncharacterized protein